MKNIIRVIPLRNGVFARLGGGGTNGILPGKCGVLDANKTIAINKLKELYPADDYEIIDVNQEDHNRPFKPVNITKIQTETTKTTPTPEISIVPENIEIEK